MMGHRAWFIELHDMDDDVFPEILGRLMRWIRSGMDDLQFDFYLEARYDLATGMKTDDIREYIACSSDSSMTARDFEDRFADVDSKIILLDNILEARPEIMTGNKGRGYSVKDGIRLNLKSEEDMILRRMKRRREST